MKIKYLIIDGNSLGYSCYFGRQRANERGEPVGALYNFIKTMHRLLSKHSGHIPIILWDGKADWRLQAYPAYKSKRNNPKLKERKADYKRQQPFIVQAMHHLGVMQMLCPVAEADDLAYTISSGLLSHSTTETVVHLTTDSDWWQLITDPRVCVKDFSNEFHIDMNNYQSITGVKNYLQYIEAKCLSGDKSDSIHSVTGFCNNPESAKQFINKWGSVQAFYAQMEHNTLDRENDLTVGEQQLLTAKGKARFELNKKLIDLSQAPLPPIGEVEMETGNWNESEFFNICKEQSLLNILKRPDFYLRPFSNMASRHDVAKSIIYKITL